MKLYGQTNKTQNKQNIFGKKNVISFQWKKHKSTMKEMFNVVWTIFFPHKENTFTVSTLATHDHTLTGPVWSPFSNNETQI